MKHFLLFIVCCAPLCTLAQQVFPSRSLSLTAGGTTGGSGDNRGLQIGVEYEKFSKRKISWSVDLVNTIHNNEDYMLFSDENGPHGFTAYGTTAGIQVGSKMSYYFVKTDEWTAGARLGALLRRQSTSMYWRQVSGQPYQSPLIDNSWDETDPTTYAFGGSINLFGNYTINQKIIIGIGTGFQIDTNGHTFFRQLLFTIGRRF